jgi:hypothetical protein
MGWTDAHRLADLTTNLCLAYAASWIFFFVADHHEKVEDKETMAAYTEMHLSRILQGYFRISLKISKIDIGEKDVSESLFRNSEYYKVLFNPITDTLTISDDLKKLLFDVYFELQATRDSIKALFEFKEFLDSKSVMILLEIQNGIRYPINYIERFDSIFNIIQKPVLGYYTIDHIKSYSRFLNDWNKYCNSISDLFDHIKADDHIHASNDLATIMKKMDEFKRLCQNDYGLLAPASNLPSGS